MIVDSLEIYRRSVSDRLRKSVLLLKIVVPMWSGSDALAEKKTAKVRTAASIIIYLHTRSYISCVSTLIPLGIGVGRFRRKSHSHES